MGPDSSPTSRQARQRLLITEALVKLAQIDAWQGSAERMQTRRVILENLCQGFWSQGYDDGADAERERIREYLNR